MPLTFAKATASIWRRNNEQNMTGFCMSQVISRFKDNIAVTRTLSGLGKTPTFRKLYWLVMRPADIKASCDFLPLPRISVSLIRPYLANLIELATNLFWETFPC
jgi:hypothetical protein